MITDYKYKDLRGLIDDGGFAHYNVTNLIADKLKVIYTTLGWTHMTGEFCKADELVEELTTDVLERLIVKGKDGEVSLSTAGLYIAGWFDSEGMLNLDYHFVLA